MIEHLINVHLKIEGRWDPYLAPGIETEQAASVPKQISSVALEVPVSRVKDDLKASVPMGAQLTHSLPA
jgi:hypothetical protein